MSRRIYFVSSTNQYAEDPSDTICYWDPADNQIHYVSPNIDYDLGAGWLALAPRGRLFVHAPRGEKYPNAASLVNYLDYYAPSSNYQSIESDVALYTLDADLKDPQVLVTDLMYDGNQSRYEGWRAQALRPPDNDYDDGHNVPHFDSDRGLVIAGRRYSTYVKGVDESEGRAIHTYTTDGQLVKREHPANGFEIFHGYQGESSPWEFLAQWSTVDFQRGYVYSHDGWGLWQFNLATGQMRVAPSVFIWFQTQHGWQYTDAPIQGALNRPDYLVMGPYPDGTYAYAEQADFWRSRAVTQISVDPATGYVWALVHGYEPYGQEYARPGDGTPVSSSPGGFYAPGDEWALLGIDPDKLFWITDLYNPYPYDEVDAGGNPRSSIRRLWGGRGLSHPPQNAADVGWIVLTKGHTLTCAPQGTVGRTRPSNWAGWDPRCLTIPPDEPGVAYVQVNMWTPRVTPISNDGDCDAVFRVDLATGQATELFRDARLSRYMEDPTYDPSQWGGDPFYYYAEQSMFQILPAENIMHGGPVASNRRFWGSR